MKTGIHNDYHHHHHYYCLYLLELMLLFLNHLSNEKCSTVNFPNSVGKIVLFSVSTHVRLFYIRSKIFFDIRNLWILLFQMIYDSSFMFRIFIVKLAVYEKYLHLTELGSNSLILTTSEKISLILTLLINYIEKLNFKKKGIFYIFLMRHGREMSMTFL